MSKKQLVAAWIIGVMVSTILVITPKIAYYQNSYVNFTEISDICAPLTNWNIVLTYSSIILIIGSLLIYTLRSKK